LCGNFKEMDQRKYIISAMLLLVIGGLIYLGLKKNTQSKDVENSYRIIDNNVVDTLTGSQRNGEILYMDNCASCHGGFRKADDPGLLFAGMESRWPDKKELFAFIRNPEEVMKRNVYARELKNKYGAAMTAFPNLSNEEIQNILDYIALEEKAPKTLY
jgi:cytochrome c1